MLVYRSTTWWKNTKLHSVTSLSQEWNCVGKRGLPEYSVYTTDSINDKWADLWDLEMLHSCNVSVLAGIIINGWFTLLKLQTTPLMLLSLWAQHTTSDQAPVRAYSHLITNDTHLFVITLLIITWAPLDCQMYFVNLAPALCLRSFQAFILRSWLVFGRSLCTL